MNKVLETIKEVRQQNNDLWMSIIDIALKAAPEETKMVLKKIKFNDMMIADKIGKLIDED